MRADLGNQLDDMELIAGDGRIIELSVIADLSDDTAQLVKSLDSLAHCFVGNIDAEAVSHGLNDLELKLSLVVIKVSLIALHGRIDLSDEEAVMLNGIDEEKVLLHTLDGSAALGAEQAAQIIVATLNGSLKNGAGVGTRSVGHVVAGDIAGCAIRCTKS